MPPTATEGAARPGGGLVDSHCHLDAPEFDADRAAVIARAHDSGIRAIVVPSVDAAGFGRVRALCQAHPGLHPAYGLHPMFLAGHREEHLAELREWIERERPVAVGECGLDFHVEGLDREAQQAYFLRQLELAREFDLPLILHARRAVDAVIAAIRRAGSGAGPRLRGVVHSYSGSMEQARQLVGLGFLLGFGGPVTYERARRLHRLVAALPLECLLLETDAPDQPLAAHRGERNEPARLPGVLQAVARLRGAPPEEVARATTRNACALFGLAAGAD
jgi:TatD DNase family protein